MARPPKEGLEYFPLDVDFFNNPKLLRIEEEFGIAGGYITLRLLANIYDNGYYIKWNDDIALVFAKQVGNGATQTLVNQIALRLVSIGFFDKKIFDSYRILTSHSIQEQWDFIIEKSRRKIKINPNFLASNDNLTVNVSYDGINVAETPVNVAGTPEIFAEMPQRKEKKIKENKREEGDANFSNLPPVDSKNDFLDNIIEIFAAEYETSRGNEYINTTKGKERKGAGILAGYIRKKRPDLNSDEALLELRALFRDCLAVKNNFLNTSISVNQIAVRINEYLQTFQKENSSGKANGNANGISKTKPTISDILKSRDEYLLSKNGRSGIGSGT